MSARTEQARWAERDQTRVRTVPRPRLLGKAALARAVKEQGQAPELERPRTRGDCDGIPRPCPFVGCRWNLFLDVEKDGSIRFNFPHLEPHEMRVSCALDVADGVDHEQLGADELAPLINLMPRQVRNVELGAIDKLCANGGANTLLEAIGSAPESKRRLPIIRR